MLNCPPNPTKFPAKFLRIFVRRPSSWRMLDPSSSRSATNPKHVSSLGRLFIRLGLPRRCCGEDHWTTRAASTLLPFSDGPSVGFGIGTKPPECRQFRHVQLGIHEQRQLERPANGHQLNGMLLFSAPSAAALAQPSDEPSDHEHGQQENDDYARADKHIGENDSGAALDGHGARRRSASMPLYGQSSRSVRRFMRLLRCYPISLPGPKRR
jgi:hypothetical protein